MIVSKVRWVKIAAGCFVGAIFVFSAGVFAEIVFFMIGAALVGSVLLKKRLPVVLSLSCFFDKPSVLDDASEEEI